MTDINIPEWRSIHTLVFDFDGVFTDNKVFVDEDGRESVRCDRGDGLAFDILRRFAKQHDWPVKYFILSKEVNPVVSARANKLKVDCIQGVDNKSDYLCEYLSGYYPDDLSAFSGVVYFGNDLNDLASMQLSGFSIAPSDAHPIVQKCASLVLPQKGGCGFVRAAIEKILHLERLGADAINALF